MPHPARVAVSGASTMVWSGPRALLCMLSAFFLSYLKPHMHVMYACTYRPGSQPVHPSQLHPPLYAAAARAAGRARRRLKEVRALCVNERERALWPVHGQG